MVTDKKQNAFLDSQLVKDGVIKDCVFLSESVEPSVSIDLLCCFRMQWGRSFLWGVFAVS
jgi:hypothetical protein